MADYTLNDASRGLKWGSVSYGTTGGTVQYSFASANYSNQAYTFSSAISTQMQAETQQAFAAWAAVANISFQNVADSATTNTSGIRIGFATLDGAGGTEGETRRMTSSVAAITAAQIAIDPTEGWHLVNGHVYDQFGNPFYHIILHEIGHAIGLNHYDGGPAIMNTVADTDIALQPSDIHGIQYIYGARSTGTPDFTASGEGTSAQLLVGGQTVYINGRVANQGSGAAAPGNIGYYLSVDPTITTGDRFLGQITQSGSIAGGGSIGLSTQNTIPTNLPVGTYYLGFIADYDARVSESNEGNNASVGTAITIRSATSGSGQDFFRFGEITHDVHGFGGEVYALYDGLLGRAPDVIGLEHWAAEFRAGVSPTVLADAFLASPEGQARSGAADNGAFLTQLYQATLHRAPDQAGYNHWLTELNSGTGRGEVGAGFALSAEHLGSIQPVVNAGLFVADAVTSAVARIYYTVLDRAPDAAGLAHWVSAVNAGSSLTDQTLAFLQAPEVQSRTAGMPTAQFVDFVYENALGRHAEQAGLDAWVDRIDHHGATNADVTTAIGQSAEAQVHLLPLIQQGWHLT